MAYSSRASNRPSSRLLKQLSDQEVVLESRIWFGEDQKRQAIQANKLDILVDVIDDEEKERMRGWLKYATQCADQLELQAVHDRIERFTIRLRDAVSVHDYQSEIRTLREAFDSGLNYQYFYRYPSDRAKVLLRYTADWQPTISAFESSTADISSAVDCYALGQYTACVFHAMRVLEHGLRELASAVNLTFDFQQWQTIIEQIESEVREIGRHWPAGALKSDWIGFYSSAAKEFFHFKDGWRNHVSHNRASYDEPSARNVLEHVRTFMNHLSTRLSE